MIDFARGCVMWVSLRMTLSIALEVISLANF